ncbi:MAG: outer membrane protein assembly factor BamB family protein, partial [Planctomycetota bacterium]
FFYNSGLLFDSATGLRYSDRAINFKWWRAHITPDGRRAHGEFYWGDRQGVALTPRGVVRYEGRTLRLSRVGRGTFTAVRDVPTAFATPRLEFLGMKDGKHKKEKIDDAPQFRDQRTAELPAEPIAIIVAGDAAVLGFADGVAMVDLGSRKTVWRAETDAPARSLAVSDGRLFVSTDAGTICCFARGLAGGPKRIAPASKARGDETGPASRLAAEALEASGVRKGYCLVTSTGDRAGGIDVAALVREVVRRSELYVIVLERSGEAAGRMRASLDEAGAYGTRCAVLGVGVRDLPGYFANLVLVADGDTQGADRDEIARVLRPFGGVLCSVEDGRAKVIKCLSPLPGAGEWTHNFGNAGNTLYSGDEVVKGPLGMLWYEDETQRTIDRHGKNPAPLAYKGLLLRQGIDSIRCRDAYNGTVLYDIEIPGVLAAYMEGTQVGAAHIGSTHCVADDRLYARVGDRCLAFNVFTGKELAAYRVPAMPDGSRGKWGWVACEDGVLFGGLMNESYVIRANHGDGGPRLQKPMDEHLTETKMLFAFDVATGKLLWRFTPERSIRNNAIAVSAGRVHLIDREPAKVDTFLRTEVARMVKDGKTPPRHPGGRLIALDARSGRELWRSDEDVFGTLLAADRAKDFLLMSYYHVGFARPSERHSRMRAYRASTGEKLWERKGMGLRPVIADDMIYSFPLAFDLATGEMKLVTKPLPDAKAGAVWRIRGKGQGCGTVAGSRHVLLVRSATLGYYDLGYDRGWLENYGGFRAGCFINYLPAMGLVLAPDDTLACRCSYQNQATVALKEYGLRPPVVEPVPGQRDFAYFPRSKEPFFTGSLEARMWHEREDVEVRYTLDGSHPNARSALYEGPLTISETTTVRAAVFRDGRKLEQKDAVVFRKVDDIKSVLKRGMKR